MKAFKKKIFILLALSILTLNVIYYSDWKGVSFKSDVYVVFDVEQDNYKILDWSKYAYLFPKVENFETIIQDNSKVRRLHKRQVAKIDSIKNEFYKFKVGYSLKVSVYEYATSLILNRCTTIK